MPNLSTYLGSSIQFASVVLSAANNTNSQQFTTGAFRRIPFNGVLSNPNSILTLNASTSSVTLPTGLYQMSLTIHPVTVDDNFNIINQIKNITDSTILAKWPAVKIGVVATANSNYQQAYISSPYLPPAGIYLAATTNIVLEQYWGTTSSYRSQVDDSASNIFVRMDIWKLR